MQYSSYHDLLVEEFERRKLLNSAYSLRAYARDLGVSAPRLSQVLNRKHGLSPEASLAITQKLKLNESKAQWFMHSVGALHARSSNKKEESKAKVETYKKEAKVFSELHMEYFKVISDWYHFAILELTYLEDFKHDYEWMAGMLEITPEEVKIAVGRMKSLELIREEEGKLIDVFKFLATPGDVPSAGLKKFHTDMMKRGMAALYQQEVEEREMSSNIISINKEEIPKLKEAIRDFRRQFEHKAGQHKEKNAVYCLGMQFFELTRR